LSNQKIIFLDVDGTIVNDEHKMPESARKAIALARKNSHRIYLCTGCSKAEISEDTWSAGFDGIIGGNGCFIEHEGSVLEHKTVPYEHAEHAIQWMNEHGVDFYSETNSGLYASEHILSRVSKIIYGDASEESQRKTKIAFIDLIYGQDPLREDLNKFSFLLNNNTTLADMEREFSQEFDITPWNFTMKGEIYGDLSQKGINKSTGIKLLLEHLQADLKATIGIGDGTNDMEMLNFCGIGIAMGNSTQELKNIADYVTSDINMDGLWNAFKQYELI
jgi:HAD-superfamily hydrolase, subfamily IIB